MTACKLQIAWYYIMEFESITENSLHMRIVTTGHFLLGTGGGAVALAGIYIF